MAKIVEFMGSPGAGKTTIYKEMRSRWNKDRNWIPSELLFPKEKPGTENYTALILNLLKFVMRKEGRTDNKQLREAGERFISLYPDYVDRCWNYISTTHKKNINGLDLRFQKISYLYRVIQHIQILREQKSSQMAIIDEGLIHQYIITSSLAVKESPPEEKEMIEGFLEIIPMPDGIVFIDTDLEINLKRLLQRKPVLPMHKSLSVQELEKIVISDHKRREEVNAILKNKNIPYIHINSTESKATNASKIISFVETLKTA